MPSRVMLLNFNSFLSSLMCPQWGIRLKRESNEDLTGFQNLELLAPNSSMAQSNHHVNVYLRRQKDRFLYSSVLRTFTFWFRPRAWRKTRAACVSKPRQDRFGWVKAELSSGIAIITNYLDRVQTVRCGSALCSLLSLKPL